jgi:hypothetical protein
MVEAVGFGRTGFRNGRDAVTPELLFTLATKQHSRGIRMPDGAIQ